jgi:two-component system, OmpR family, heavy metal sensor histidine kinase CusS
LKITSISLRLTFWFSAIFLSGFVLFGIVTWLDLAYSLNQGRDRTLNRRAARFADMLEATRNDAFTRREAQFERLAEVIPEGELIQLFSPTGQRILPRTSRSAFPWPAVSPIPSERFISLKVGSRPFRLLEYPVQVERPFVILVAGQLEDNRNMMARFTTGLAWAIPAMLALSALAGYFLGRRVLRPVDEITSTLRSLNVGNLSRRLPVIHSGDEIERLTETCNLMLARLEDAVDRLKRFTADASHELRSPVALIRAVAEYSLRNPRIDAETKEAFGEILAESADAGLLLEDMLTLARADAGCGAPAFEPVDLTQLVEDAGARLKPLAEAKNQSVAVRTAGPAWIAGDRSSLRRLLSILLDNAIKYTPAGGRIDMQLTLEASRAAVSVKDNGIGIPEALLPRIFDRFARADPSRGEVSGTGLGLAIAKWIAGMHDATLSVQSREQEGSTFTLEFHLAEPDAVQDASLRDATDVRARRRPAGTDQNFSRNAS